MKTKIILHGRLSKKFQKEFEFSNVKNLKTVVSAINSVHPDFKSSLLQDARQGINYQILIDRKIAKNVKNENELKNNSTIEIVPCLLGADPATIITTLIVNLLVAGITYLMTPDATPRRIEASIKGESYIFATPDNLVKQGQALPLGYGRLRVGSQIISSSITNTDLKDINIDNSDFGYTDNLKDQISDFLNLSLLNNNYL